MEMTLFASRVTEVLLIPENTQRINAKHAIRKKRNIKRTVKIILVGIKECHLLFMDQGFSNLIHLLNMKIHQWEMVITTDNTLRGMEACRVMETWIIHHSSIM